MPIGTQPAGRFMRMLAIAAALFFIGVQPAISLKPEGYVFYEDRDARGCWGLCAYRSSMAACISCGLYYHGEGQKPIVFAYCRKLQPVCGRK